MPLLSRLRDGSLIGGFARDVTYLTSGAAAAQIVLLGSQVVLARLYTPDERGAFSIALAYASILAVFATMRYEMAIPLAADEPEAHGLLRLCLRSAVGVTLAAQVALVAVAVFGGGLGAGLGAAAALWLVPVTALSIAAFTSLRLFESRRGRFGAVGTSTVWGACVTAVTQIGAGLAGLTMLGLTAGYAAGRFATAVSMGFRAPPTEGAPTKMRIVARRWQRMPLLNTFPALLTVVSVGAVAPFVAWLFGREFAGQFGLATQVLAAPAALLGTAVAGVLYPKMARLERESTGARSAIETVTVGLVLVALPVFVAVGVLGPELFAVVFGVRWFEAGVLAALLAPWLGANFVSTPLSSYATVRNRMGQILLIALVEMILRLVGLWMGVVLGDPLLGVLWYGIAGFVICVAYVMWVLRLAGGSLVGVLARLWGSLVVAVLAVAASLVARSAADPVVVIVVGAVGVAVLLAACTVSARHLVSAMRGAR
ncbi:O-antigen/teichoic acid export membrane protein [Kineosphaera limosa]|uniref:lipopolysaccharide biosynthesis protein n=1 Tax=Kineosphaera limosa TaxID=111564 RepID=UPI0002EEB1FE|nr:oligosaccharide flippase family protein [Kineosphaera limosa]NYE01929.1 O-antigen/teichoic acid export membrane protein [Kineosphaera limosa]